MPTKSPGTKKTENKNIGKKNVGKKEATAGKSAQHSKSDGKRKWSASVTSDATHPPEGLFNEDAKTIARSLASAKISPKGPASGMRMLTFYINRAGKNLPKRRLQELERAKELLHKRIEKAKQSEASG